MKPRRLIRLTCAACLLLCAGSFAYRAAAAATRQAGAAAPCSAVLLHGKQLLTFAGYELNVTFTPGGDFYCFEIQRGKG